MASLVVGCLEVHQVDWSTASFMRVGSNLIVRVVVVVGRCLREAVRAADIEEVWSNNLLLF